jgi:Uma2 family endonuclease
MDQTVVTRPETVPDEGAATLLRLTAEQVGAMCDAGVFGGVDGRVELREGLLYKMRPLYVPHAVATAAIHEALRDALLRLGSTLTVLPGASVRVGAHNLPIPDILVWEPMRTCAFVPVERVRFVVEICGTTHADDLGTKPGLYARGGIPEYWVVDLPGRAIHQRWAPADGAYAQARVVAFGEPVTSATLPDVVIATAALLDADAPEA